MASLNFDNILATVTPNAEIVGTDDIGLLRPHHQSGTSATAGAAVSNIPELLEQILMDLQ